MEKHIEELAKLIIRIQEDTSTNAAIDVDGIIYHVSPIDLEDFILFCNEEIEDFIRRVKPRDDEELSNLISIYIYSKLQN